MKQIFYFSTNLKAEKVSFRNALLQGLAPDRGLYMPDSLPAMSQNFLSGMKNLNYPEIASEILYPFVQPDVSKDVLIQLTKDAYNFPVPIESVDRNKYILRLDQGPTASFKDFAARMMARLMNYFLSENHERLLILTATSGDTGSAIANAFYGLDNIDVVVLFPEKEITTRQRKQMTTLGKNIRIIALNGKFDDCQALVKTAFSDEELKPLNLSSANSINIGRLLPQSIYYFYAWSRTASDFENVIFSVPSGNFGNMMGGMLAKKMGLPVKKFIIATNENDVFPKFLETAKYEKIVPSRNCISSAMNVGHPSNMARLVNLFGGIMDETGYISRLPDMNKLREEIFAISITDDETRNTIKTAWNRNKLLLEPHGAVAWAAVLHFLETNPEMNQYPVISIETAHPAKFPEEIISLTGINPDLPPSMKELDSKPEHFEKLENNYSVFKKWLMDTYSNG